MILVSETDYVGYRYSWRSIKFIGSGKATYDFLLVVCSDRVSIFIRFWDTRRPIYNGGRVLEIWVKKQWRHLPSVDEPRGGCSG